MLRMLTTATVLLNRSKNRRHSSESRQPLMSSSTKLKAAGGRGWLIVREGPASAMNVQASGQSRADDEQSNEEQQRKMTRWVIAAGGPSCGFRCTLCNAPGVHSRSRGKLGR